jgi:hypothetical protein
MKRFLLLASVTLGCLSCEMLGLGKQCYTCTTEVPTRPSIKKVVEEVCGKDEKDAYIKKNQGNYGGVFVQVSCVNKR